METSLHEEREARAARNQALFRSINERIESLNEAFEHVTQTFTVACECADMTCVEMLDVAPGEYEGVRAESRQFIVRTGHIYPDVETVVREADGYVIVEKVAAAGEVAESLDR